MVKFSQKVTGTERKNVAAIIAEATGQQIKYAGVPTYAYEIGGYSIDKDGVIHSPSVNKNEIANSKTVLDALSISGLNPEGELTITLLENDHTEDTLRTLKAVILSKAGLLKKSLSRPQEQDWTVCGEGQSELKFTFFNATLNFDELKAYVLLADKLSLQAKTLKYCSAKEHQVENEKYALRCFLLRLGFIGDDYKVERKVLLKNLPGNSAFKSKKQVAEEVCEV